MALCVAVTPKTSTPPGIRPRSRDFLKIKKAELLQPEARKIAFPMDNLNDAPRDGQLSRFELPKTRKDHELLIDHIKSLTTVPDDPQERAFYGEVIYCDIFLRFEASLSDAARQFWNAMLGPNYQPRGYNDSGEVLFLQFSRFLCGEAVYYGSQLDWSLTIAHIKNRWAQRRYTELLEAYAQAMIQRARILDGLATLKVTPQQIEDLKRFGVPELKPILDLWRRTHRGFPLNRALADFVHQCLTMYAKDFPYLSRSPKQIDRFIRAQAPTFAARVLSGKSKQKPGQETGIDAEGFLLMLAGAGTNLSPIILERRAAKA